MKKLSLIMFLCYSSLVMSQLDSSLTLSGSLDLYFRQNINSTNDPNNGGVLAPPTSFANLPGFAIGMANLKAEYSKNNITILSDFVFGPRGKDALFNSPSPLNILNQLNIAVSAFDKLKFTFGKFNTFIGYEYISPVGNSNYSTSYLFSYGPFNHTGLKVNYDLGKGFGVMGAILNPTDFTDYNPNNQYLTGFQLSYTNDFTSIYLNNLLSNDYYQYDITGAFKFTDKYTLGLNASIAKDEFQGIALYNTYSFSKNFDISTRLEYFEDMDGDIITGINPSVVEGTLSLNIKPSSNIRIIPEWRIDLFRNQDKANTVLLNGKSEVMGNKLSSILLAVVANF